VIDGTPLPLLSRRVLGRRDQLKVGRVLVRLVRVDSRAWRGQSMRDWLDACELSPRALGVVEALVRTATYVAPVEQFSAEVGLDQLRASRRGVSYLEGGWQQLTDKLWQVGAHAGAELHPGTAVKAITGEPGAWQVHTAAGEVTAGAVVVAAGSPSNARRLLPLKPAWGAFGPQVTVACLDLGLNGRRPAFTLGVDEPLYLSAHAPPGDLAPKGRSLVHVMRYGASTSETDRAQLWKLAASAGIRQEQVCVERFLHRMVVAHCLPGPESGLSGRPPVTVCEAPGLFVAGDWAGDEGWLAAASLASGSKAGMLATRACEEQA
jgi:phytoene dehydrogenase-like protein